MRDRRFVAVHRGGPLKKEQHRQLMQWAFECAMHIMPLTGEHTDHRLVHALKVALAWQEGKASVGEARRASVEAHAAAREATGHVAVAVARSVGQAVATAHMADHSMGAAWYALKAVKSAGKPVGEEREWQDAKLPVEIRNLVLTAREMKKI
ncbi:MAG TPA: hypothetical protein VFG54_13155 [Prolixibacteraceae bacterium]|nr:hypothetical protein [Prolixibacteraceae bacterium]